MKSDSVWNLSGRLLFGQTYEDSEIERRAFPPGCKVFCIASAGCTAIALSRDHDVTAVDVNPAQVEYARSRAAGAPRRLGLLDRLVRVQRGALIAAGWTRKRLDRFLQFSDCAEQLAFWHAHLNTRMFRALFDCKLAADSLGMRLITRDRGLPSGSIIRKRVERGLARYPNRSNPYAHRLFGGPGGELPKAPVHRIEFKTVDALAFLESVPPGSFEGFSLSNIADGATADFRKRLLAAVRHAASGDAMAVLRSVREPEDDAADECAAQDRTLVWGSIQVRPAGTLR